MFLKVNGVMENAITGFTKSSYKSLSLKLCCNCHDGQRRNVNPLDFRDERSFSTAITSLDGDERIWPPMP